MSWVRRFSSGALQLLIIRPPSSVWFKTDEVSWARSEQVHIVAPYIVGVRGRERFQQNQVLIALASGGCASVGGLSFDASCRGLASRCRFRFDRFTLVLCPARLSASGESLPGPFNIGHKKKSAARSPRTSWCALGSSSSRMLLPRSCPIRSSNPLTMMRCADAHCKLRLK